MVKLFSSNPGEIGGGSVSSFQWSSSEKEWPFEKASDGSILYCKEIDLGSLPNNGTKNVSHNIPNFTADKLYSLTGYALDAGHALEYKIHLPYPGLSSYTIIMEIYSTHIYIATQSNWSNATGVVHMIYKK